MAVGSEANVLLVALIATQLASLVLAYSLPPQHHQGINQRFPGTFMQGKRVRVLMFVIRVMHT